jgi:hypothetical protein
MQNIPIDVLAAFIGVYAALQCLSMLLTSLEVAAKRIEGRSTWVAKDGTMFEEFAFSELQGSNIMKKDFEESTSDVIFAPARA